MMTYLVTGSNGMIGSQIYKELRRMGWNTHSLTKSEIDECNTQKDLQTLITSKIRSVNGVFHVGAIADTSDFSADMIYYNYHITKLIINSCSHWNVPLIFSSTQMVKGRPEVGYPENIYGWSKVMCEDYGFTKAPYTLPFVALRYTNVYGPGEEAKGKSASLAYQSWLSKNIDLWDGRRDFVYVKDVVSANIYAMNNIKTSGSYWVASGETRSAIDLVRNMGDDITIGKKNPESAPPWFQWETSCDPSRFMSGWTPKYTIESGTADYLNYLKNN